MPALGSALYKLTTSSPNYHSSHLPYKLKSPLKRIPYSSTKITEDILMEISCHELDIEFLTPPNEHYRRIEDSRWKEDRIEINNKTVGECKQLFLCFLWFIQCSSAIKLLFVVDVQMKAQWCKWMDEYEWVNHYILLQEVYWMTLRLTSIVFWCDLNLI